MTEKTKKIKEVMKLLDNGKTVKVNGHGELWLGRCRVSGKILIYWRNFGQSANGRNLKELTWIINTIFNCKGKDFTYAIA